MNAETRNNLDAAYAEKTADSAKSATQSYAGWTGGKASDVNAFSKCGQGATYSQQMIEQLKNGIDYNFNALADQRRRLKMLEEDQYFCEKLNEYYKNDY